MDHWLSSIIVTEQAAVFYAFGVVTRYTHNTVEDFYALQLRAFLRCYVVRHVLSKQYLIKRFV
jgi:hypothetical protein